MPHDPQLPVDLGDGLVLRQSRIEDAEPLAAFNADIHRREGAPEPSAWIAGWTRDLMRGNHPTHAPDCFTLVEERATGRIVSALNLISQTWSYGGVPFGVGRVELVGTAPEYRRRGLIRRQFEVVHRWSAERGEPVQAITGIPWYYRQFGYEYALDLSGGRLIGADQVPKLPEGETESFRLRRAVPDDAPFFCAVDAAAGRRFLVNCVRDEAQWRYEIAGRDMSRPGPPVAFVVESFAGQPAGYVVLSGRRNGATLGLWACELAAGVSWYAATPSILRALRTIGAEQPAQSDADAAFAHLGFFFETVHPIYRWLPDRHPRVVPAYGWYVRVADLPAFLRRVAPVLEARLTASDAPGYAGALRLSFYRDGLRLRFAGGELEAAERWSPADGERPDAAFPGLTFLQLLFGHRSFDELAAAFPDCWTREAPTASLLDTIFPKVPSNVYPLA